MTEANERPDYEVEVRLVGEAIEDAAMRLKGRDLGTVHRDQIAREALAALEPIRQAERERAWIEGVESCDSDHMSYYAHKVSENGYSAVPNPYSGDDAQPGGRQDD